ncbi:hypothetical protein A3860_39585 [Niastella vici]|uniref:Adhesin domain-containing protein n=1 Tax=Niastella vici TaxID=1703345 RepID=A0A1V9FHV8_9BACT|nr:hypothetical protein [Niastella vici]OQP57959.1 hypothetical protein A3860_39585 [Niastella vici]
MKKLLFFLVLFGLQKALHAQQPYIYTIKADSVKITNTCDTAELIIENHTQNVPGFLFNKGRGRTEFRRINQSNDTTVVIGSDTIHLGRANKNFANADLTLTGERFHNGAFHPVTFEDFEYFDFKAKADGWSNEIGFSSYDLSLYTQDESGSNNTRMSCGSQFNVEINKSNSNFGVLNVNPGWSMEMGVSAFGGTNTASIGAAISDNEGLLDLHIQDDGGNIQLRNNGNTGTFYVDMKHGDSISFKYLEGYYTNTKYLQTKDRFVFRNDYTTNDFRLIALPTSSSTSDNMLVIDGNGQVKTRSQVPARKSATVTGSTYTVPSDIDVVFVNYTSGQATITLPTGTLDREITIKNLHTTNTVIVSGLDTSESNSVGTRGAITVKYTGSAWVGISKY